MHYQLGSALTPAEDGCLCPRVRAGAKAALSLRRRAATGARARAPRLPRASDGQPVESVNKKKIYVPVFRPRIAEKSHMETSGEGVHGSGEIYKVIPVREGALPGHN